MTLNSTVGTIYRATRLQGECVTVAIWYSTGRVTAMYLEKKGLHFLYIKNFYFIFREQLLQGKSLNLWIQIKINHFWENVFLMDAIVIPNLMIFLVPYSTVRVTAMYLEKGRIKIVMYSIVLFPEKVQWKHRVYSKLAKNPNDKLFSWPFLALRQVELQYNGGFHLVDLIITELKDHMTSYEFKCSHWLKIYL